MKVLYFIGILQIAILSSVSLQAQNNYRVDNLSKGFWRVQAVQGTLSTVYVIEGNREVLVIDACTGQEGLKDIIQKLAGNKTIKLTLTHGHFDHSGGIKYFDAVYLHSADTSLLPKAPEVKKIFIDEGYVFDLGDQKIEVLSIPGHTPGSVAFYNRAGKYILTGDGIGSTSVWAHISEDPLTVFLASLKRLEDMKGDIDELYVGHHEQEKVKLTTQYITDMRIAAEKVLDGSIDTSPYISSFKNGRQATYGSATLIYNPDLLR
jgi:glyoxylase-like metal-dependent hydrolase (beta-lactamase superfamily II)